MVSKKNLNAKSGLNKTYLECSKKADVKANLEAMLTDVKPTPSEPSKLLKTSKPMCHSVLCEYSSYF